MKHNFKNDLIFALNDMIYYDEDSNEFATPITVKDNGANIRVVLDDGCEYLVSYKEVIHKKEVITQPKKTG